MEFKDYEFNEDIILGPYTYQICNHNNSYWLTEIGHHSSDIVFEYLGIKDTKRKYIQDIVGYDVDVIHTFPKVDTLKDLNKVIKQLQIDCLIKEAKEKYPVGTRYWPTLIPNTGIGIFIVGDDQKVVFNDNGGIYLENPDGFLWNKERNNHTGNQNLYYNGRWAEIITKESKQPEINTYGLKVGDKFPAEVLIEWIKRGENRHQKDQKGGKWHNRNSTFIGNRTIKSFKNIDGVVGFLVSDTNEVYLRAEGFKEFAESFDKPKFEVGKWYKKKDCGYFIKYFGKKEHNSRYATLYSEFISSYGEYKSYPEGTVGVGYVDEDGWYELKDLSEIQQYLPDGHPDKIKVQPEYIVGKWYRLGAWIAKFKELDGDKFRVFKSGTPFDNYKFPDGGHLSIKYQGTPVLITDMTEVYKLFPEEKPDDSDLQLERWYEKDNFIVYLYARNSVYGFHHDKWFESNGFSEEGLKLCHPQKIDDKFSAYIRNKYQIGDTVTCPYDQQIFKIKELDLNIRIDRIIVSALGIKKRYGFLFYQGKWAELKSDWKISERELNYPLTSYEVFSVKPPINLPNKEKYYAGTDIVMPDYDKCIKENSPKQESTTELLLKSKNKKQKFVKLTEIQTIKV